METDGRSGCGRSSHSSSVVGPGFLGVGSQAGASSGPVSSSAGFAEPFAGTPQFEHVAPTEIANEGQLNQPLGQPLADEIAREIGLNKSEVLTQAQYRAFITGQSRDGSGSLASAELVDESVKILTNTIGHPLAYQDENGRVVTSVLASYGLFVTTSGELESPAYETAPTYLVNQVIMPNGYMSNWMKANFARKSLEQLYRSAYTSEVVYGNAAQNQSKPAELITNVKGGVSSVVGMSMGPALWIVEFRAHLHAQPFVGGADACQVGSCPSSGCPGDQRWRWPSGLQHRRFLFSLSEGLSRD